MSEPVRLGFILQTQREREEKEEPGRVIRDSFQPHHKDRLQPGSFAVAIPASTGAGMLMEPSPQHRPEIGGGARKTLVCCKSPETHVCFHRTELGASKNRKSDRSRLHQQGDQIHPKHRQLASPRAKAEVSQRC